jgi:RimJ/RimL family protein N-acetyltransferase
VDDEIVGLCGFKDVPSARAEVEIGYGIAASRRRCGYASEAVALMLTTARRDPAIAAVLAETAVANLGSQGVLRRNGFRRMRTRCDPEDGELIVWRRLTPSDASL